MRKQPKENPDDIIWNFVPDENTIGTKTILFIISIPFLMVLGKFLIVWDIREFISSTIACIFFVATFFLACKKDKHDSR